MREIKTCPEQNWKQMPTEELDKILQAELTKEYPDEEVVLPILRELEEREKDFPVDETPENLTILNKLNKHEAPSKRSMHKRRWISGIAAAAAVVCIIVMALPRTVGAESIFDVLARWTNSVFEFIDPNKSYPDTPDDFYTDHDGLRQLYNKVTELGATEPVVPMWLPEGFELLELEVTPVLNGYKVYAVFGNGNDRIMIVYRISSDITGDAEKEDVSVNIYDYADVDHFIFENEDNLSVTWKVKGAECLLNTSISRDALYTLIKSIYRSELSE